MMGTFSFLIESSVFLILRFNASGSSTSTLVVARSFWRFRAFPHVDRCLFIMVCSDSFGARVHFLFV